jgi:hypothetical protein
MSETDYAAWVKAQRDPALWHQAAMAALAYRGDPHGFLPWLLEQPEMDRATAGWIFLWAEGSRYLRGVTDFPLNHITSEAMMALFRSLCGRSESVGFPRDDLGLARISGPRARRPWMSLRETKWQPAPSCPGKSSLGPSLRRRRMRASRSTRADFRSVA